MYRPIDKDKLPEDVKDWQSKFPQWPHIDYKSTITLQKSSIGLCQVMGSTAIDMGFNDVTTKMTLPEVSLEYGVKYWYLQSKRFDITNPLEIYFAYNTGGFSHSTFEMTPAVTSYGQNLERVGYYES